jgi:hypothetical protein
MSHLRLVPALADEAADTAIDDRPHVSLRLLMAASGRCSCDECLWAYRRGDKDAGIVRVGCTSTLLTAVP